jgi:tetratricopeptide (TPR) repeat protein
MLHLADEDAIRLVPVLYRETAGNPFFVVETLRTLVEQGILFPEEDGRWAVRAEGLPDPADLPMSEAALRTIRGRIRRLSRAAQEVLTVATVIEHDIDEKLLARLVDPSLSLDLALDEVLRSAILEETAPGLYQFSHLKVREILYADTSAPRRRFLHHRVAEVLAQMGNGESLPTISRLAYHYARAREWTHVLIHGWRAAQTAWMAGAMAEANRYAGVAQEVLDERTAELDTALLPEPLPAIRFDLLALRAEFRRQAATAGLYYPPEMIQAIEELLDEVDDSRRARASLQQARHRLGQGDLAGAREAVGRGRALYAQQDDFWGQLDAVQHQLDIAYHAGDMVAVWRLLDELRAMIASFDPAEIRQMLAYHEMRLAVYQGDWTVVLRLAKELSSAQEVSFDPAVAWLALSNLGLAYMKLGAFSQAHVVAQRAIEASEDAHVLGLGARVLLAKLELWRGSLDQARAILLDLLERPDPLLGEAEVVAPALVMVRCCVAAGDSEGAKQWAQRASQAMSRVRLPMVFPLSQVAWALAHLAAGRYDDAQRRLYYPLEYLLLSEDTSPQEIFVLRAVAARGMGDEAAVSDWLTQAWDMVQQQAAGITDPAYRDSFLNQVPLHQFIARAIEAPGWSPDEVLSLPNRAADWAI